MLADVGQAGSKVGSSAVALTPPSLAGLKDWLLLLPWRECHLPSHGRDTELEGKCPAQLQRREGGAIPHRHRDDAAHREDPGLATLCLGEPDSTGYKYGPESRRGRRW